MFFLPDKDLSCRLVDNLATALLLMDDELQVKYMNSAAEAMLGLSFKMARGMELERLFLGVENARDCMENSLKHGQPYAERELDLVLVNGEHITVDCTVTPVQEDKKGGLELLVELVQVDRHLRINREETLFAQEKTVRALVRGMAHEIKNPLGGLRGAAQLLERELPSSDLREYTQVIISEADRLQSLVDRMLGPRKEPKFDAVNILEVTEHVLRLTSVDMPDSIRFQRDYDPSLPDLSGDKDMLIQVVLNLVRNAMQAFGNKGGTITLRTRAQRYFTIGSKLHRLALCLEIIDDGPGIAPDMIEQIFYPMVTTRAEGTGLGLPLSQSMVHLHGGLIECHSQPGETVFAVYLPFNSTESDRGNH